MKLERALITCYKSVYKGHCSEQVWQKSLILNDLDCLCLALLSKVCDVSTCSQLFRSDFFDFFRSSFVLTNVEWREILIRAFSLTSWQWLGGGKLQIGWLKILIRCFFSLILTVVGWWETSIVNVWFVTFLSHLDAGWMICWFFLSQHEAVWWWETLMSMSCTFS